MIISYFLIYRYDLLHNQNFFQEKLQCVKEIYTISLKLCKVYVPIEYLLKLEKKAKLSRSVLAPLLGKIHSDLMWWKVDKTNYIDKQMIEEEICYWRHRGLNVDKLEGHVKSAWRHVRTRLYFTCASHMYTLFNILGNIYINN